MKGVSEKNFTAEIAETAEGTKGLTIGFLRAVRALGGEIRLDQKLRPIRLQTVPHEPADLRPTSFPRRRSVL